MHSIALLPPSLALALVAAVASVVRSLTARHLDDLGVEGVHEVNGLRDQVADNVELHHPLLEQLEELVAGSELGPSL